MRDDFAFSSCKTREEWQAENHRQRSLIKSSIGGGKKRQQRIARGEPLGPDPFFDPESIPDLEFADSVWSLMNQSTTTKKSSAVVR